MLAFICALGCGIFTVVATWLTHSVNPATILFGFSTGWFVYRGFLPEGKKIDYVLELGRVRWNEEDFCRGWEIDGRTGSGKTASAVVPIIHALKKNRPDIGILALDTKGDLSEPLAVIVNDLHCEKDLVPIKIELSLARPYKDSLVE